MMPVAIVGRAWRTPLGRTVSEATARLLAGERAATIGPRTAGYACGAAAPIPDEPARSRQARFLRRMGLFGLEVAREAFADADPAPLADRDRIGLFAGVGGLRAHWDDMLKALEHQRDDGAGAWERGLRDVHPYWMLRHLSNNVHALAAIELGLRGEGATFGGATGGAQALAAAARALHAGAIDAALVVAYDSLLEPETLVELGARRAASVEREPARIAPPYDTRASGFVPGEAAAAIVVVRAGDASAEPASSAVVGAIELADGERAEPAPHTLSRLLARLADGPATDRSGGTAPGFVDGAARAWPERDAAERSILAEHVPHDTPLTAITAAFGQLGAATSIVQAIALAELLHLRVVPPIANLQSPSAGPLVPSTERTNARARCAVGVSTGAPGLAAAIAVEVAP